MAGPGGTGCAEAGAAESCMTRSRRMRARTPGSGGRARVICSSAMELSASFARETVTVSSGESMGAGMGLWSRISTMRSWLRMQPWMSRTAMSRMPPTRIQ